MKIQAKKSNIILIIIVSIAIGLLLLGYQYFIRDNTVTNFRDQSGIFYECTQPIPVKWTKVPHSGGKSDVQLVAADPNDVKKFCETTRIE